MFGTLFEFDGANGSEPETSLIQGRDGNFYGVTAFGGVQNKGTIFKITPSGTLTTLYSFCAQSGLMALEDPPERLTIIVVYAISIIANMALYALIGLLSWLLLEPILKRPPR